MTSQGQWTSNTVYYNDPKYNADMRVQMHGTYVAEVADGSELANSLETYLADQVTPILEELLPSIHYSDLPAKRAEIASTLKQRLVDDLASKGVTLKELSVAGESYKNPGFIAGFVGKAGPVLALAGLASIVLYFVGLNLKILVWIDAWGAAVGWAIRIGAVVAGVALMALSNALDDD